jgi:hypothetical protein
MQNTINNRTVLASQAIAAWGRSPTPSYIASTSIINGVSLRRFNILCCIFVAVVVGAAFGAIPFTNVEWQRFNNVPADRACFTGRVKAVNNLQGLPVPLTLVLNLLPKQTHADIRNGAREAMVSHHAAHIQVFNADYIKSPHKVSGELMQRVGAGVGNVLMQAGNPNASLVPTETALLSSRQPFLQPRQFGQITPKIARVCNSLPVAESGQSIHTQVNTDNLTGFWQLGGWLIEAERHIVPPGRFLDYRNRCGGACKISAPMYVQSAKAGENKVFVGRIPPKCLSGVFGRLPVSFLFEGRILAAPRPEIEKCSLKVAQSLLGRNTRHFRKPYSLRLFFQSSEHSRGVIIADSFLFSSPSLRTKPQRPIVHISHAAKYARKCNNLLGSRIETETISCFHTNKIYCVSSVCNIYFQKVAAAMTTPLYIICPAPFLFY